ncbi:MAG: phage antirepressor KilAC domain-containing protein [Prevotella sp.]|nr:phage antirepressor KilAC domain-containing protein [Prevotella sp.]
MKNNQIQNPTGIQIFSNSDFGSVRTLIDGQGAPLFCLKDVCSALALDGKQVVRRLDDGVVSKHPITDSMGRLQQATFVNEDGLYDVVLDSRKPSARAFRKWVTSEVLPQIRQTGGYIPTRNARTGEELTEGEIIQRANGIMQRTIARRNLPADDCLTTTDIARGLGMDVKELNHLLVDKGIIRWTGGRFRMMPQYSELGYDESRLFCYRSKEGEAKERTYLVWTPRGKTFIEGIVDRLTD